MADRASHLLVIDTCGAAGTLALARLDPEPKVVEQAVLPGRSTSERLLPAIQDLLQDSRTTLGALAAIAIVHGPGSFTGIRVGLSAAKGFCEALRIPLIAISRLAVLALESPLHEALALLDAGRGELYVGHYLDGRCLRESLMTREQVLSAKREARLVACEDVVRRAFPEEQLVFQSEPAAKDALRLAAARFLTGNFDDIATVDANYVRRTDLEIFAKPVRTPAPA